MTRSFSSFVNLCKIIDFIYYDLFNLFTVHVLLIHGDINLLYERVHEIEEFFWITFTCYTNELFSNHHSSLCLTTRQKLVTDFCVAFGFIGP